VPLSQEELTQILLNLAMNAADACAAGGQIVLCAEAPNAALLRIRVDDNGKGIASEVTDHLFEPFVTTKEVGKGTGLGLAVTRGLVEGAGGKVWAEASPLGGARFVIEIPAVLEGNSSSS
jgi:signal transduction histidine kinase